MPLDLVTTVSELIATPSVNPMGRQVEGPEYLEHRVTDYLQRLFDRLGLPTLRQHVAPRRENILARLDGAQPTVDGGPLLLWEVHQDTVPVDGMTIEPFEPAIRQSRIYGRGACDIKGGMAAMLVALARLVEERPANLPTIVLACTVNEEHGFTGASALCDLWGERIRNAAFFPRRPDAAIVAEPTMCDVVVAHKGVVRWRAHTLGRAVHSSQPELGENAIYAMGHLVAALDDYHCTELPQFGEHPRCGRPSLNVGTIHGGLSVNTVPDRCTIEIDRRLLPGEDPQEAYRHVLSHLSGAVHSAVRIEHEPPFMISLGLDDTANGPLAEALAASAQSAGSAGRTIGVPYGTDASAISAAGVPSVVFGPGSIDQAHTKDEWLALDQLERASEVLYRFARSFAGSESSQRNHSST